MVDFIVVVWFRQLRAGRLSAYIPYRVCVDLNTTLRINTWPIKS